MRKPNLQPPDLGAPKGREIIQLKIRLATPMIGGGAIAQQVDEEYPIRASAIRGALRHWWRASVGSTLSTANEMRAAEASLFGSASGDKGQPGKVGIRVVALRNLRESSLGQIANTLPQFAIGLFTPRDILDTIGCAMDAEFDVEIACPMSSVSEVKLAVDCWIAFGGLGARSRRGFGALELVGQEMITPRITGAVRGAEPNEFSLAKAQLLCGPPCNCMQAWQRSVELYAKFRKGERPGATRPNTGLNSHTPWPEADDYRVSRNIPPLRERGTQRGVIRAPRASLGLPLQLRSMASHSGSFGSLSLSGNEDRLASSIITKPIFREGSWRPGMLIVHRPVRLPKISGLEVRPNGSPVGFFDGSQYQPLPRDFESASELLAFYLSEYGKWQEVALR